MQRRFHLIILLFSFPLFLFAQKGIVQGRVIDLKTSLPIPFASVYINYTTLGVYTNDQGEFSLSNLPIGQNDLIVSSVGYINFQSKITVKDSIPLHSLIKLSTVVLKEVVVTGKKDAQWKNKLERFKKLFFGRSEYASQCRILNPFELNLNEDSKGGFTAQAESPLVIENLSLGYRIFYQLKNFQVSSTTYSISGSVRFEEMETQDSVLISLWQKKRKDTYSGSSRHLFKSIIQQNVKEAGFALYEDKSGIDEILRDARFLSNVNKRLFVYDEKDIVTTIRTGQYSIALPSRLEVHYLKKSAISSVYTNVSNPVSWIEVKEGSLSVNEYSVVLNPNNMTLLGAMSDARIAEILPNDYQPRDNEEKQVSKPTKKTPLTPLSYLVEKPYLHTDKSYYYPKEIIWIKGYMNYVAPVLKDSLSHTIYIELINPSNKSVLKKIYPITDGHIIANLSLPSSLPSGNYQLRAYTRWMLNFDSQLLFTKAIKILNENEFTSIPSAPVIDSISQNITFSTDKEKYKVREKITMNIQVRDFYDYPIASNLSVSVTDWAQAVPADNELKITSGYFISKNALPDSSTLKPKYNIQYGIELDGLFKTKKNKPAQGKLTFVQDNSNNVFTITTEKNGEFFFPNIQLYDTVNLSVEARSIKGKKDGQVILDSILVSPAINKIDTLKLKILRSKIVAYHHLDTYDPLPAHLLEEVIVNDTRIDNNSNRARGTHLAVDYTISGDWLRETNSYDVLTSLQSKVPGLRVPSVLAGGGAVQKFIQMGGPGQLTAKNPGATEVLVLIDGVAVNGTDPTAAEQVSSLNPNSIERIEVIKQGGGASYGVRGGNGVIAIYTRKGNTTVPQPLYNKEKLQPLKITGYTDAKKFKSPDYTTSDENVSKDYRSTIYWNPLVITDDKATTTISFFAADTPTYYRIVIEGVTKEGNPVRGERVIKIEDHP